MPPPDAPSPSASAMPPPPLKRPRQPATVWAPAPAPAPRAKRRKPEESGGTGVDAVDGKEKRAPARARDKDARSGVGAEKEKDEEEGERDFVPRIDFRDLPVETLYRYLEVHDLLPRWDASPWSEDPCTLPNALYTVVPQAAPPEPLPAEEPPATSISPSSAVPHLPPLDSRASPTPAPSQGAFDTLAGPSSQSALKTEAPELNEDPDEPMPDIPPEEEWTPAPRTTRSKTLPQRKAPTPTPEPTPAPAENKRGVVTLSDVHAAREVLAEKANAHWVKGLGGGQNKESETIVNFLYKMKVGPGRLLRVYNPNSSLAG